jgi:hypothetical protein
MAVDAAAAVGSLRTLGVGAASACSGNDARLSNARPPTAHKSTHEAGGADAIKLDDLAAPDNNSDLNASLTAHGLMPILSGVAGQFFDSLGGQSVPVVGALTYLYATGSSGSTSSTTLVTRATQVFPAGTWAIWAYIETDADWVGEPLARVRLYNQTDLATLVDGMHDQYFFSSGSDSTAFHPRTMFGGVATFATPKAIVLQTCRHSATPFFTVYWQSPSIFGVKVG